MANGEDAPFELLASFDRIDHPPRGRDGGGDGAPGYLGLAPSLSQPGRRLPGKGRHMIPAGARLIVSTPGGGGIGDPATRDPTRAAADLANGLVVAAE